MSVACGCIGLSACANGGGQQIGTVLGAVAGGVLGNQVGGPYKQLAIVGGAVVGALIGSAIGKALDDAEREAMQRRMAIALNKGKDGEAFSWASHKSNATAQFAPEKARKVDKRAKIVRASNIEATPPLELVGEPYIAKADTKLLAGPRSGASAVGTLKKGEPVIAMGKVKGQPWMAVGRDNKLLGYVPNSQVIAQSEASSSGSFERVLYAAKADGDSDRVQTAAASGLAVDDVETTTACREISFAINKDGTEAEKGKLDACKTPEGHWSYTG